MFQSTCVLETGLSEFYLTVMRKIFKKMHPRVITYRSYRDMIERKNMIEVIKCLS